MKFTILGSSGFIGSHLAAHLRQQGHECFTPERSDPTIFTENLGHVIYCIGLTADFRQRPFDTVRAHVCVLADVLERCCFDSLIYLSSTRIYGRSQSTDEDSVLTVDPQNFSDLYNLTKLTGESLCFATGRPTVRVARLSNVYGADFESENFLPSLIRDAVMNRGVELHTSLDSAKDYVSIDDVVDILPRIALSGRERVYNVASGKNVANKALIEHLSLVTGCTIVVADVAVKVTYPAVSIDRISQEFKFEPRHLEGEIQRLVERYTKGAK